MKHSINLLMLIAIAFVISLVSCSQGQTEQESTNETNDWGLNKNVDAMYMVDKDAILFQVTLSDNTGDQAVMFFDSDYNTTHESDIIVAGSNTMKNIKLFVSEIPARSRSIVYLTANGEVPNLKPFDYRIDYQNNNYTVYDNVEPLFETTRISDVRDYMNNALLGKLTDID